MRLRKVVAVLDGQVVTERFDRELEVRAACGADLMSDVLAFAHLGGTLLLTGLTNPQVVRTAEMASVIAIIFVRGKTPPSETIRLADEKGIPLLTTKCSMFEACGRLYSIGLESCDVQGSERHEVSRRIADLGKASI